MRLAAAFESFLHALRQGDHDAAEKLVHLYGPDICRLIRARLQDGELRRVTDSVDICQSILFQFVQAGIRAVDRKLNCRLHVGSCALFDFVRALFGQQPALEEQFCITWNRIGRAPGKRAMDPPK